MILSALIREGHIDVMNYGYEFMTIAMDELSESKKNNLVDAAFSHRISQTSNDDWNKFVGANTPKPIKPKTTSKEQHMANLRAVQRLK